jgi:hypothetical protein
MRIALRAGMEILLELGSVDNLPALFALRPEAVRHLLFLRLGRDIFFGTLEPCHGSLTFH